MKNLDILFDTHPSDAPVLRFRTIARARRDIRDTPHAHAACPLEHLQHVVRTPQPGAKKTPADWHRGR